VLVNDINQNTFFARIFWNRRIRGKGGDRRPPLGRDRPAHQDRFPHLRGPRRSVVNATDRDKEKYKEEMSEFKKLLDHLSPTDFNVPPGSSRKLIFRESLDPQRRQVAASSRRRPLA